MYWRHLCKMFWRRLQNVLKTLWRCLENVLQRCLQHIFKIYQQDKLSEDVLKKFWRRFCKMSLRRFEDVLKTLWQDTLKTSQKRLEDIFGRCLEDILKMSWRHMTKTNILVFIRMAWGRLEDIFWRRMSKVSMLEDEDERRHQDIFIKTNVCWGYTYFLFRLFSLQFFFVVTSSFSFLSYIFYPEISIFTFPF